MPAEITALIQECTRGSTKASSYRSRLGLVNEFTDPTKPGRPGFKSNPTIHEFWIATNDKVHAIALLYKSRNAIREALIDQRITLDETVNECLEEAGHKIWNDGLEAEFLTTPDVTGALSEALDAECAPKFKNASEFAENGYPRHLIYEDPDDRNKIRLNVFGYIIQRACRKAEDDRREGKAFQAEPEIEDPTPPTNFMDAVRVGNSRCIRSMSPSSDSSTDELARFSLTTVSNCSKPKEYPDVPASKIRSLRKSSSTKHDITRTHPRHVVSVVIPPNRRAGTGITALENSQRKQSGSRVGSNTAVRSTPSHNRGTPRREPQVSSPRRMTAHHMTAAKAAESSAKDRANLTKNTVGSQLLQDRGELGIQLLVLLESHNPERQDIAKMQKVVGHVDMMAVKYTDELRKGLDSSEYEKYKGALDKWLACMRTLVEFREATGLSGDGQAILGGFRALPLGKKKARRPYSKMAQEIREWRESDGMTLPVFCKEVGSILLKMASFAPLRMESDFGMELDELLVDLIPFTKRLMECFLATSPNS